MGDLCDCYNIWDRSRVFIGNLPKRYPFPGYPDPGYINLWTLNMHIPLPKTIPETVITLTTVFSVRFRIVV